MDPEVLFWRGSELVGLDVRSLFEPGDEVDRPLPVLAVQPGQVVGASEGDHQYRAQRRQYMRPANGVRPRGAVLGFAL
jgi:hypothetical protein